MSTVMKLGAGLLLLVIVGAAGAVIAAGRTSPPADDTPRAPAAEASAIDSREEVVRFLRHVGPAFQAASKTCFAAEQCGSLERTPSRGALGSAQEMPGCLKARLLPCAEQVEGLITVEPPSAIAQLWEGALQFRVGESYKHATLTSQLIIDTNGPPDMTIPPNKTYVDVEDWVAKQHLPIASKYAALREQAAKWQQDTIALDDWVLANNLCSSPGVRCTLDRAMSGR